MRTEMYLGSEREDDGVKDHSKEPVEISSLIFELYMTPDLYPLVPGI